MEKINCDLCGSSSSAIIAKQTDLIHKSTTELFNVVKCHDCGLNYTNPRPDTDQIGSYYSDSYTFHHNKGIKAFVKNSILGSIIFFVANSPLSYIFSIVPTISNFLGSQIRPSIKDPVLKLIKNNSIKNFLDIGCGSGINAHFWGKESSLMKLKRNLDVYGCEIDQLSREYLNNNGVHCWSNISQIDNEKKFDIIRMNWSLEHAHYPSEYFEFFKNHLTKNGKVIIGVPNSKGLLYQMEPNALELPIHLHHFSIDTINKYCIKNNLEIINSFTFSYPSMFHFAKDVGLLSEKFNYPKGIFGSKKMQTVLNSFDEYGLGNDLVVTLKMK